MAVELRTGSSSTALAALPQANEGTRCYHFILPPAFSLPSTYLPLSSFPPSINSLTPSSSSPSLFFPTLSSSFLPLASTTQNIPDLLNPGCITTKQDLSNRCTSWSSNTSNKHYYLLGIHQLHTTILLLLGGWGGWKLQAKAVAQSVLAGAQPTCPCSAHSPHTHTHTTHAPKPSSER